MNEAQTYYKELGSIVSNSSVEKSFSRIVGVKKPVQFARAEKWNKANTGL